MYATNYHALEVNSSTYVIMPNSYSSHIVSKTNPTREIINKFSVSLRRRVLHRYNLQKGRHRDKFLVRIPKISLYIHA